MKNFIYVFIFSIFATSLYSQGLIEREYANYLDQDDVTHVYVSGKLFDFASIISRNSEDKEMRELSDFASKIESFSLIKVPNSVNANAEFKKGINSLSSDYEELMRVKDEGTKFVVFVDEENDVVFEIVGLGVVDGEFIALSLVGEMDLNKIAEFISHADSEALVPFKRLSELKPNELKVYPNPTSTNTELNIDVPEGMVGGQATLYNVNGTKIKTIDIKNIKESIKTNGLSPGNYFVEVKKESVTMKKQVIIIK